MALWEGVATNFPERVRIPAGVSEKAADRMKRNFAFDRARYLLPVAMKTNAMLVQSARAWVGVCQHLLSHPLPEAVRCGEAIREELALVAPRLIKHARPLESLLAGHAAELETAQRLLRTYPIAPGEVTAMPTPHLDGRYTAFGAVVSGMDVIDALEPGDRILKAYLR